WAGLLGANKILYIISVSYFFYVSTRDCALGTWKKTFSTLIVAARMPVCLRINTSVTRDTARLTYGLPGSALAVRDSHPLDD
ncbi:MAG: hypothetical protein KJN80_00750, partial [Deltaproteobacteria bacterium]|nr:hypothetical protein [Deltaproteobacteria bacterium]